VKGVLDSQANFVIELVVVTLSSSGVPSNQQRLALQCIEAWLTSVISTATSASCAPLLECLFGLLDSPLLDRAAEAVLALLSHPV